MPSPLIALLFALAAALVWWAGSRLPGCAAAISARTRLGQAFVGMVLLGGITTLPELATSVSAALMAAPRLALNNAIGSTAFNVLLLAIADAALGRRALTSVVATPSTLLQGVLGILLLALAAAVILVGERPLPGAGVGAGATLLFAGALTALWIAARHDHRPAWAALCPPCEEPPPDDAENGYGTRRLVAWTALLAALIMAGGVLLAATGEQIAERTGLGSGLVGVFLLAAATSLPELSTVVAAVRRRRYQLAVGDVFGANLYDLGMILPLDLALRGAPILAVAGTFEAATCLLALLLTGIYVVGFLERRDRTFLAMGYDSGAALILYAGGAFLLATLA